jgi:undecaprenyl-diphosphatase
MPDWLSILVLSVIEGITEFLPVSSTGHLLLAQRWLARQSDLFNIVIQCGAVVAVLPLFPDRCRQVLKAWRDTAARDYVLKLGVAFVLTGVGGLILDKLNFKLTEAVRPVALALMIGGILFLVVERWLQGRHMANDISWAMVVLVAAGQLLAAVFPGLSRSGATILLLLACGLNRSMATEFSFLVGVPTLLAAGGLKIAKALFHPAPGAPPENWPMVGLGTLASAVVSFLAVRWLLRYVQSHTFVVFGWYRVALGGVLLLLGA